MIAMHNSSLGRYAAALALSTLAAAAAAQAPAAPTATAVPAAPAATAPVPLSSLAWMEGCWKGLVNNRDFREQWMALRGNLMVGVSQTTMGDKTIGYEYLRFEPRADGVYYVILPSDAKEDSFRLSDRTAEKRGRRHIRTFHVRAHVDGISAEDRLSPRVRGLALRGSFRKGRGR